MSFKEDFKRLLPIVRSDPAVLKSLRSLINGLESGDDNWLVWIILKERQKTETDIHMNFIMIESTAARKQNYTPFAHCTEKLLLRRLTPANYNEYAMDSLMWGSWEFKLVLLWYFVRRTSSVLSHGNILNTLDIVRKLTESFRKVTEDRFGLDICPKLDSSKFVGELIIQNVDPPSDTVNGKKCDTKPKYQRSTKLTRNRR